MKNEKRRIPDVRAALRYSIVLLSLGLAQSVHAQQGAINPYACGSIKSGYGPFDYRTAPDDVRHRVEDYHFTPDVESGRKGNTAATAGPDLDYTLRAFPNNPRALLAVSRYGSRMKSEHASGLHYPVECYFERAIRFLPTDPMPHVLYAIYLKDRKRDNEARAQLDEASNVRGDVSNYDVDYNLGLLYFELGVYDKSLVAAKRAYALGAPLPALQKKLKAAGKWNDDPLPAAKSGTPAPVEQPAAPPVETESPSQPH